ncbi:MAG: molybdate ABC transporter substrate-binding protein [Chloroflexi bacterium]|nr:molybdate ABC transporter substrate-binding protein [Chloroflexota bacterium]
MIRRLLLAGAVLVVGGCRPATWPGTDLAASPPASLTVYAAASLKAPLAAVRAAYESAVPGVTLTISSGSSAALRTQIEQGAPADVFLSADTANAQRLVDAGLAAGPAVPFAGNELAVVVPKDNPAGLRTPADLANPGVAIVAAGDAVPITAYATQLIENLAALPGYPGGFAAACAANIVSKEEDVQAVVAKIALGEGDAAITYATDVIARAGVTRVAIPPAANVRAAYAGVVVKAAPSSEAATAFLAWLAGSDGQAILAGFGFLPPP